MATPRTQNRRSSFADRSATLACVPWHVALIALILTVLPPSARGVTMNLSSAAGGITIAGGVNVYTSSMGNMNALAVPPAGTGMTALALSNGALYYSPIRMRATGMVGGHTATVTAYVSTNFSHPVAAIMYGCPTNLGCTSYSDYTVLSTNAATPTTLGISPMTNNIWYTGGLAIFVPDNDGASAFAGTNTVTITFRVNESVNNRTDTATLNLTAITQTAVQLTLGTAAGGATIAAGADFSLNFGNVNGLGIGPAARGTSRRRATLRPTPA